MPYHSPSMIGKKVKVFWPVDEQWYTGTVQEYNEATGEHKLMYPDGDTEWVKIGENGVGGSELGAGAGGDGQVPRPSPGGSTNASTGGGTANSSSSPRDDGLSMARSTSDRSNDAYGMSPGKQSQMYGDMIGAAAAAAAGMHHGSFNPYHAHPSFGMGPYGPPFGGPAGAGFHTPFDMRGGMQYPPHHRMSSSPNRNRSRGSSGEVGMAGGGDRLSPPKNISSSSPQNSNKTPDSSDKNLSSSGTKKKSGPKTWSKEEDTALLTMVQKMRMPIKWSLVAQSMPDRTGKQCRERYVNHLNPRLKSCDWSPAEDATIFHLYNTCGSQWAKMSKMIPGRTDNGIKNRFHNLRRQLEREDEHRIRLSKPEDFPEEVKLDKIREFPKHLSGKCSALWDMDDGVGVLAAQSVLGGSFARNAGRFGPFRKADPTGEQCARCGLFAPSSHCGMKICTKSGWCIACTRLPPHMCGNILRECLNLRQIQEDTQDEEETKLIKAGALNLALADAK